MNVAVGLAVVVVLSGVAQAGEYFEHIEGAASWVALRKSGAASVRSTKGDTKAANCAKQVGEARKRGIKTLSSAHYKDVGKAVPRTNQFTITIDQAAKICAEATTITATPCLRPSSRTSRRSRRATSARAMASLHSRTSTSARRPSMRSSRRRFRRATHTRSRTATRSS